MRPNPTLPICAVIAAALLSPGTAGAQKKPPALDTAKIDAGKGVHGHLRSVEVGSPPRSSPGPWGRYLEGVGDPTSARGRARVVVRDPSDPLRKRRYAPRPLAG